MFDELHLDYCRISKGVLGQISAYVSTCSNHIILEIIQKIYEIQKPRGAMYVSSIFISHFFILFFWP